MLHFKEYSDFNTFKVVYDDTWEIGVIIKRNNKWVFAPDNSVNYLSYEQLEGIMNKLWSLNVLEGK
jgi:hypothetical protein